MLQILESGMVFGDYEPEQVFRIENSRLHHDLGDGIKSVEFILHKGDKIFFIEAKSSSPKGQTDWTRYQEFLGEITDKFVHSFNMLCACYLHRLSDGDIGEGVAKQPPSRAEFVFVLVIRGHKKEWLLPLQQELNQKLRYHHAIWKSRVIVMNDVIAREYHLII